MESAFSDVLEDAAVSVPETAPDIEAIRAKRGDALLGEVGPNVIEICKAADMVYMGLHGESGENGKLQALFDVAGVRYTGSGYLGSALAMHKWISKDILLGAGSLTPAWQMVRPGEASDKYGGLSLCGKTLQWRVFHRGIHCTERGGI